MSAVVRLLHNPSLWGSLGGCLMHGQIKEPLINS